MASWTIVAVPRDDDPVWKLSSEKIPHMTLLYLGEQNEPAKAVRIAEYLQHAVETTLQPFGVTVDRRGTLGRDQADVLFFEDMLLEQMKEFRSYLLKDDDIAEAYHSADQYPKWTPHLTLGYPKTPAKKNPGVDYDPTYISFDRISFWIEDFDGPEFRLKSPPVTQPTSDPGMAHSDTKTVKRKKKVTKPKVKKKVRVSKDTNEFLAHYGIENAKSSVDVDDFLAHYGVKGMKWGVRRSRAELDRAAGRTASATKEAALSVKSKLFSIGVRLAPREMTYGLKRALSKPSPDDREVAREAKKSTDANGVLPKNKTAMNSIEKVGLEHHKSATYDLDRKDIGRLKKYTDAAWYSRSVNSYLATGKPPNFAGRAQELKETLQKTSVDDLTVYRSTSLNFSFNGVAKKLDTMSEAELKQSFDSFSKNYKGKSFNENRVFSTSTSPNFAIDTWREVNPNAAANYNTYMVIKTEKTPGLLADGRTTSGGKLVNTRSNQEAILAPKRMRYESLSYDQERDMFAITVTALGDDNDR